MTLREINDTVKSRFKQRQDDIYSLSLMVRMAVLSVFSNNAKFPRSADDAFGRANEGNWKNSYNYMKALQKKQGGA